MSCGCPIIYVPGIMGSQLYLPEDGRKLWFSPPAVLTDAKRLDIHSDLLVKNNGVDLQTVPPLEKEYGVLRQDVILIEWLCRIMPDSPVYFFSYDFRKSCREAAESLHEQIAQLAAKGFTGVNIVCHSMGGLVTSAYAAKYGTEYLNKIVMLGVPFEGSYEVIRMYLTGDIREVPNILAETVGITREMVAGFPGVAELMPTIRHLAASPLELDGKPLSSAEMETALSRLIPKTYADARMFQKEVRRGYRLLLEKEDCFFGIGYGKSTLQSLSLKNPESPGKQESSKGDGLVSCFSSTMGGELLALPDMRVKAFSVGHANLLRFPESLKWIAQCIKGGTCIETELS